MLRIAASSGKHFNKFRQAAGPRVRSFRERADLRRTLASTVKRVFPTVLTGLALLVFAAGIATVYFYNHYAAVVDRRIESGFWHSRGGIYAAPYRLKVGRRAAIQSVVERLRRAGYVEGQGHDAIWNGGFLVKGDRIEIFPNPAFATAQGDIEVVFSGNRIAAIKNGGSSVDEYLIEPELLTGRSETKRSESPVLTYDKIPENLRNAIMAAEDQRFFSHYGVDPRGIARAIITNLVDGEIKQGGSTITQQLVKNTFLSPEKSFSRKFAEALLAVALERRMSKEQIFALYCNEIYLGQYGSIGVHGVEQAARVYFGKELTQLNLTETAAIAAMIKNPKRYAPHKNGPEAEERRKWIIAKMGSAGFIGQEEAAVSAGETLRLVPPDPKRHSVAPYFVDAAIKDLDAKFDGEYLNTNFNRRVYTTIDTYLQNLAETAVANRLAKLDPIYRKRGLELQASIVALDPRTGHVLALVGGRDYAKSQFNRAAEAYRQPGSTFKPFVYAAALENGLSPITVFSDSPTEFAAGNSKPYKPANYGDSYAMTDITLKTALARSSNVVAVKTALETGLANVAEKAAAFGFGKVEPYPSMALGTMEVTPLQLAAAYAAFANGGRRVEPTFIDRVVSADGRTLYFAVPEDRRVISEKTAFMITDMLGAAVERGTARSAHGALGKNVAFVGKTGSSKDGWFVGYTPNLVTVVWIGVDDSEDIGATGGEIALPLWVDFMKAAVQSRPEYGGEMFIMPSGLTKVTVDPTTGMLADRFCPIRESVVLPTSAVSNVKCVFHQPMPDPILAADLDTTEFPSTVITIPADEPEQEEVPFGQDEPDESRRIETGPSLPKQKKKKPDEPISDTFLQEYLRVGEKRSNG